MINDTSVIQLVSLRLVSWPSCSAAAPEKTPRFDVEVLYDSGVSLVGSYFLAIAERMEITPPDRS